MAGTPVVSGTHPTGEGSDGKGGAATAAVVQDGFLGKGICHDFGRAFTPSVVVTVLQRPSRWLGSSTTAGTPTDLGCAAGTLQSSLGEISPGPTAEFRVHGLSDRIAARPHRWPEPRELARAYCPRPAGQAIPADPRSAVFAFDSHTYCSDCVPPGGSRRTIITFCSSIPADGFSRARWKVPLHTDLKGAKACLRHSDPALRLPA